MLLVVVALIAGTAARSGTSDGTGAKHRRTTCAVVARNDAFSTIEAHDLTIPDPGVTANDDLCGGDGVVAAVAPPSNGVLSNFDGGHGGFTYTPTTPGPATDIFTYRLANVPNSPVATVTITIPGCCTTTTPMVTTSTQDPTGPSTPTTAPQTARSPTPSEPAEPVSGASTFTG